MKLEKEMPLLQSTLLLLCNRTREDYLEDPFLHAVVTQISMLIYDLKYKTTEQYIKEHNEKAKDALEQILPFKIIQGNLDEECEKISKDT